MRALQLFSTFVLILGYCLLLIEAKTMRIPANLKCVENQNSEYKTIKIPENLQPRYRRVRQLFNFNKFDDIKTNNRQKFDRTAEGIVYHNHDADFVFPEDSFRPHSSSGVNNGPYFDSQSKNSQTQSQTNDWQGMQGWQSPNNIQDWGQRDSSNNNRRPQWTSTTSIPEVTSNTGRPNPRPNLCQIECHKTLTNEYNPVCGSDNVTYSNPGKFKCAKACGKAVSGRPDSTCGPGTVTI